MGARAQDATWVANPTVPGPSVGTFDFNANANWTPATVPTGTGMFGASTGPSISFSQLTTTLNALQFNAGAPVYNFTIIEQCSPVCNAQTLNLTGSGIVNNAAVAPTFTLFLGGGINFQSGTAANANIVMREGNLDFRNLSTAGSAIVTMPDSFHAGFINFHDSSSAQNANITVTETNGAQIPAELIFLDASTAGNATISNNQGTVLDPTQINGGRTEFGTPSGTDTANAGTAHITNNKDGGTNFLAATSALNATIVTNNGGYTNFQDQSTAGNATITNNAGGFLFFGDQAGAGASTITNAGSLTFGFGFGFGDTASAGTASITNNSGGTIQFNDSTTAGSATITTNNGASTQFLQSSTGGDARFIVNSGGAFDMSGLTSGLMTAGSIEGAGNFLLGSNTLSVGSRNANTTVSGAITGAGSLELTGSGTLTLTGSGNNIGGDLVLCNCVTGGLNISGGAFIVSGNVGVFGGTLTVSNGGTLNTQGGFGDLIGLGAGANGTVLVTGAGSTWTSDNGIIVGGFGGTGTLTIANGGSVVSSSTPVDIEAGSTLNLGNGGLAGSINTPQITLNGATSQIVANFTNSLTLSADIVGDGSVTKNGSGTLILTSDLNQYFGGTTISAGTLQLGNGGSTGFITGDITDNGVLAINRAAGSSVLTLDGNITGTGSVQQFGGGTTVLSGNNSYGGGTSIASGIVEVTNDSAMGTGTVTLGSTLRAGADNLTFTNAFQLNDGAAAVDTNGNTMTLSGVIAGLPLITSGLTKTGAGTLILSGHNTYSTGTIISDGTLQVTNSQSAGTGAVTMDGGTFQADGLSNLTFTNGFKVNTAGGAIDNNGATLRLSGTISDGNGAGALQFVDSFGFGRTVLSGANTYSGGTTVTGTTLQVNNNSAAGTGAITLDAAEFRAGANNLSIANNFNINNTFFFGSAIDNNGNNLTLSGVIADGNGPGALSFFGAGKTTLTGANTYTGGTFICSCSTLQLGNGGTTGSIVGDVINGGTLIFNRSNSYTFAGAISDDGPDAGRVMQNGSGTTILSGANSYSAGTTISAGTLQANNNNAVSTGTVTLNGGAFQAGGNNLSFSNAFALNTAGGTINTNGNTLTLSGVVANGNGAGALLKAGSGTLVLTNTETYTGATTVNAGSLAVTGNIAASSSVTVNNGAAVFGTGTLARTTVNSGGTLMPGPGGNTPGTLAIQGNLAFASGAFYLVQAAPGNFSRTNVSSTASLNGTAQANFASGTYAPGSYIILTATGGLSGTFANFAAFGSISGARNPHLTYDADDVFLVLDPLTITLPPSANGNQAGVAGGINNAINNGGTVPPAFLAVSGASGAALSNALTQLEGSAPGGGDLAAMQLMNEFLSLQLNPFASAAGGNPASIGGGRSFAAERPVSQEAAEAYAAVTPKDRIVKAAVMPADPRWSVWGGAFGGTSKISGDAVAGTADTTPKTYGFAGGADYHATRDTLFGFALAGGGTSWGLSDGLGGGRSDAFLLGAYGSHSFGPGYLSGVLGYAWHAMTTDRTVAVVGTEQLRASFNAQNFGGRIEAGYRLTTPYVAITPYAAVQLQRVHTPAYSESVVSGAGNFPLSYGARDTTATRTELGTWLEKVMPLRSTTLALRGRAAWARDHSNNPGLSAVFQTLPGSNFIVNTTAAPANLALLSAGAEIRFANNLSVGAKFDGEFARRSQSYAGTGVIKYVW
jgi:autotransporter-associated beta strand protein